MGAIVYHFLNCFITWMSVGLNYRMRISDFVKVFQSSKCFYCNTCIFDTYIMNGESVVPQTPPGNSERWRMPEGIPESRILIEQNLRCADMDLLALLIAV